MPVSQIFEKKDDAPEWLRSALLEKDGKFVFEAELPTETAGLKTALQKEREAKAEIEKALKGFEGVDPEEARRLKAEFEKLQADKLKNSGDWETREKQLKDQLANDLAKREQHFQAELAKATDRSKQMQQSLEEYLIDWQATAAIAGAKGVPELLLPHVRQQVRVFEQDGKFVARVIDANGTPRIADVNGTPFTIANLVEEMKTNTVFGRAFEASGVGGSGAQNGTKGSGTGKTMSRSTFNALSPADQMAFSTGGGTLTD